jgi:hypothetical protein
VESQAPPAAARLVFREAGLMWGKHLVVWLNQKRAGIVTPQVPDLAETGPPGVGPYAGWREGSVCLPAALLTPGIAALQFSVEDDVDPASHAEGALPLAVKEVALHLLYPEPAAPPVAPTAAARPFFPSIPAPEGPMPSLRQPLLD